MSPNRPRPDTPALVDSFGRTATDLRVSVTDKCNLRCTYCMPAEGLEWMPDQRLLTDDEIVRLIDIAVRLLGVTDVRLTGGEPLLRPRLEGLVARIAALRPRPRLAMTTNGIGFAKRARAFADAGLDRVNISLDTINPETFERLTRRDRLRHVLDALAAARDAGLEPIKINAVLMRGVNEHEAPDLLRFALDNGYHLRFIEQMPLDAQHGWNRAEMITADEILDLLGTSFTLTPSPTERGGAPAERWLVNGGPEEVGIIPSVTRPFCKTCERTRLTADGAVRSCLFSTTETDLRTLLRNGADDEEIANAWRATMWGKLAGHEINEAGFAQPIRPMSAIGG
ncbi:cyclic pyranopterin phosphate synthase [Saccharomonospora viridis]|jgi:cyclic pyranopterin phosphate synthase|uniref:GTP 3',8-cyclase n=3 Tax=Saccharomonospora viridis TaxID=1852 RepID=C7N0H8_SACVD|nr:GTP 3',8-cyclase MoaA [Saccharomonospora viridis]ACU98380.1 GTP cyclohydrolase subunit MoaA [Saccharomonospora viridis DSM 43017]KHF44174.1 molybdenum cofactor biosynthesis protein MoeA [Saccharomonospora viridis]SFP58430.1 cyclic pyranopterin phosphate synthase [Saccharomonospora viridis]